MNGFYGEIIVSVLTMLLLIQNYSTTGSTKQEKVFSSLGSSLCFSVLNFSLLSSHWICSWYFRDSLTFNRHEQHSGSFIWASRKFPRFHTKHVTIRGSQKRGRIRANEKSFLFILLSAAYFDSLSCQWIRVSFHPRSTLVWRAGILRLQSGA